MSTRQTFVTSRLLDFFSEKELVAQIGHSKADWPLVAIKELLDNALDACEEAGIAPEITVTVAENSLSVQDNGPGLPAYSGGLALHERPTGGTAPRSGQDQSGGDDSRGLDESSEDTTGARLDEILGSRDGGTDRTARYGRL
jgi:hypothetical protein